MCQVKQKTEDIPLENIQLSEKVKLRGIVKSDHMQETKGEGPYSWFCFLDYDWKWGHKISDAVLTYNFYG